MRSISSILVALLLAVCLALVAIAGVHSQNEVHPCNGRNTGFARDINSCNHFWRCGVTPNTRGVCPDNNRFEPDAERCVRPTNTRCFECTARQAYELLSVSRACHQFTRCFNGLATLHACPRGLVYDGRRGIRNCNLPPVQGGCHRENDNDNTNVAPCPNVIGRNPLYIRDRNSCSRFFICARPNETPMPGNCQNDLHFNMRTGTCDLRANAGCEWDTERPPPGQVTPGPAIACPDGGQGVFVPCRATCNRFYACTRTGPPVLQFCAEGFTFDHPSRECMARGGRCWAREHGSGRPQFMAGNFSSPAMELPVDQLTFANFPLPNAYEMEDEVVEKQDDDDDDFPAASIIN